MKNVHITSNSRDQFIFFAICKDLYLVYSVATRPWFVSTHIQVKPDKNIFKGSGWTKINYG